MLNDPGAMGGGMSAAATGYYSGSSGFVGGGDAFGGAMSTGGQAGYGGGYGSQGGGFSQPADFSKGGGNQLQSGSGLLEDLVNWYRFSTQYNVAKSIQKETYTKNATSAKQDLLLAYSALGRRSQEVFESSAAQIANISEESRLAMGVGVTTLGGRGISGNTAAGLLQDYERQAYRRESLVLRQQDIEQEQLNAEMVAARYRALAMLRQGVGPPIPRPDYVSLAFKTAKDLIGTGGGF